MPAPDALPVATLGFPRVGPFRELKRALEAHWAGRSSEEALLAAARELRTANWTRQLEQGATVVPVNDFSLYDHVLDTTVMLGALPERVRGADSTSGLRSPVAAAFAAARGTEGRNGDAGLSPSEMTKWFDTNYHYLVPELHRGQAFVLGSTKPVDELAQARDLGLAGRPVLVGPVTYLLLAKATDGSDPLELLPGVLPVYAEVLRRLAAAGADWVQLDEPALVTDLRPGAARAYRRAYEQLAGAATGARLLLATYFGPLGDNLGLAVELPVAGLHLDLVRGADQLGAAVDACPADRVLSLGVVDGRNVWRADLRALLGRLEPIAERVGRERLQLAPSCPLLHVPVALEAETRLPPELVAGLSFATEKIAELRTLARGLAGGASSVEDELGASDRALASRATWPGTVDRAVRQRVAGVGADMRARRSPFAARHVVQGQALALPLLPTTTIGSFPQTPEVRQARAARAAGSIGDDAYDAFLADQITEAVRWQEELGLDVLVHGEFERNDMVQYFAERLDGFVSTEHAWVQSYGSRCVRPPILAGDVSRPAPITVRWTSFAQSLTRKPVKGMLTGPVTMLEWSFVRDDVPRAEVAAQVALALRDEVHDLEAAGIGIIQIDEAALREGLPLRRGEWGAYLGWAVGAFRLASSGVADTTQIHTHMCYSEFNDVIDAIAALDADVISIEAARSNLELLEAFAEFHYPNEIGPGVYDIHAPRVPGVEEMVDRIERAAEVLDPGQLWVNPDCGLKTRRWDEVRPALANLVEAARRARRDLATRRRSQRSAPGRL